MDDDGGERCLPVSGRRNICTIHPDDLLWRLEAQFLSPTFIKENIKFVFSYLSK